MRSIKGMLVVVVFACLALSQTGESKVGAKCGGFGYFGNKTCDKGEICKFYTIFTSKCVNNTQKPLGKCGGLDYEGPTQCPDGYECKFLSVLISRCEYQNQLHITVPENADNLTLMKHFKRMYNDLWLTGSLEYADYVNIYKLHKSAYQAVKHIFQEKLVNMFAVYENETVDESFSKLLELNEMSEYVPVMTTGDGNCYYHSLSRAIVGHEGLSDVLKMLTFFALFDNYKFFVLFMEQWKYEFGFKALVCRTIRNNEYANELNIIASALFLKRPVFIYGTNNINSTNSNMYTVVDHETTAPIFIAHAYKAEHFVAVLPQSEEQVASKNYTVPERNILFKYSGFFQ